MKHSLNFKSIYDENRVSNIEFKRLEENVSSCLFSLRETISLSSNKLVVIQIHVRKTKRSITGELKTSRNTVQDLAESENRSRRFLRLVCLLRLLHEHLQGNSLTTFRDIFYQNVPLYTRQTCLNEALRVLSLSLDLLLQSNFKILASAKGLIWGGPHLMIQLEDRSFRLVSSKEPQLIPTLSVTANIFLKPEPDVIIIIEKDAVFKEFCSYEKILRHNVVALTGKGFPDQNSQLFVSALCKAYCEIPILVFVDSDVYGLEIYGQFAKAIPETNYLTLAGPFLLDYSCGWLPLRDREWRLMINLLKRTAKKFKVVHKDQNYAILHRELTRGLILFKKAEMNVMKSGSRSLLSDYLWRKVEGQLGAGD